MPERTTIAIPPEISAQVLTVGLAYKNPRGGIGSVIRTYSGYFEPFQFVATYRPQKSKWQIYPYFALACVKLCWVLATRPRIKIVHIHGAAKGSLVRKYIVYVLSRRLFGKKVIYHSHGSELKTFFDSSGPLVRKFIRHFFERVDQVICLSGHWKAFFIEHFHPLRISVLENIVEEPANAGGARGNGGLLKMLFLGAIGNRKGIFDLLEVLSSQRSAWEGKVLLIVGGTGEDERFHRFIREHQIGNLVRFEGWVEGDKKRALLLESDVYILPSYNEGLPISILEAMSYGLPVISTPVGGTPEVVREDINGFLIAPGDKAAFAARLQWCLSHRETLKAMGRVSLEIVQPYYASRVIPKLLNIYTSLLQP